MEFEWIAHYSDNECLPQYDPITKKENKWEDVETGKVIKIGLYPFMNGEIMPFPSFEVPINEGMKPITFRRKSITVNLSGEVVKEEVKYAVGYVKDGIKYMIIVDSEGSVIMSNE